MGENIADLAGLPSPQRLEALAERQPSPVIDGLTGDQRFFMGFAQVWRTKKRDAAAAAGRHRPALAG